MITSRLLFAIPRQARRGSYRLRSISCPRAVFTLLPVSHLSENTVDPLVFSPNWERSPNSSVGRRRTTSIKTIDSSDTDGHHPSENRKAGMYILDQSKLRSRNTFRGSDSVAYTGFKGDIHQPRNGIGPSREFRYNCSWARSHRRRRLRPCNDEKSALFSVYRTSQSAQDIKVHWTNASRKLSRARRCVRYVPRSEHVSLTGPRGSLLQISLDDLLPRKCLREASGKSGLQLLPEVEKGVLRLFNSKLRQGQKFKGLEAPGIQPEATEP